MDSNPPPAHSSTFSSFPILAISIMGILTTAILLLSYYIFVTKCCLNWHHSDILLFRFSSASSSRSHRHRRPNRDTIVVDLHATYTQSRGLDASTINSIPAFRFDKILTSSIECAVCLSDFQEQEVLRMLPNCSHSFHIDCIDTWLQSNTNCPLCRAEISLLPMQQFIVPLPSVQDSRSSVVIEIQDNAATRVETTSTPKSSPGQRRFWQMKSMGDECIDVREKDERFVVQPMRRSFSMDSLNRRQLCVSVQEILRQNANLSSREARNGEGSSSGNNGSRRIRRSLFSFGRSFRSSSVLPMQSDLP